MATERRIIVTDSCGMWFTKGTVISLDIPEQRADKTPVSFNDYIDASFGYDDRGNTDDADDAEDDCDDAPLPDVPVTGKTWHGVTMTINHAPEDAGLLLRNSKPTNRALTK